MHSPEQFLPPMSGIVKPQLVHPINLRLQSLHEKQLLVWSNPPFNFTCLSKIFTILCRVTETLITSCCSSREIISQFFLALKSNRTRYRSSILSPFFKSYSLIVSNESLTLTPTCSAGDPLNTLATIHLSFFPSFIFLCNTTPNPFPRDNGSLLYHKSSDTSLRLSESDMPKLRFDQHSPGGRGWHLKGCSSADLWSIEIEPGDVATSELVRGGSHNQRPTTWLI
jgi:hypothetical protein